MADTIPTTKADLIKTVSKSLDAQNKLRSVMAGVAALTQKNPPVPPAPKQAGK